jgi:integrase
MSTIKLRFVQAFRDVRGGRRHYFRRRGQRVALPGLPGSAEFMAAYAVALTSNSTIEIGAVRSGPGTIAALVAAYYGSAEFKHEIKPATARLRRSILEKFRELYGDRPAALMHAEAVRKVLAKIESAHTRSNWLKALRALMGFAQRMGLRSDDPTLGVKVKTPKSDGFKPWEESDIDRFRAHYALGTRARLAFELLLNTGQRRSDVIRMGRQHVRGNALHVKQDKTGMELVIPIRPELRAAIDGTPHHHLTFLTTDKGAPFTGDGFGHWFRDMCDEAGINMLAAHGLRKAACRRLAEAGCTEKEIAAISGHKTLREVARYTESANKTLLAQAATRKLAGNSARKKG